MRATPLAIILFMVSFNLSLYLISAFSALPSYNAPYTTPQQMEAKFAVVNVDANSLIFGGLSLGVGVIGGWLMGNMLAGGTAGLLLGAMSAFFPALKWAIFGLPQFLGDLLTYAGASSATTATVTITVGVLISVTWLWFLIGFISQRNVE